MKDFFKELLFLIIFILAVLLFIVLVIVNFFIVAFRGKADGYFFNSALNFDKYGNVELRTLWNATLIVKGGYEFGREKETISSVLGKNQRLNKLSVVGKALVKFLDTVDKMHCESAIIQFEDEEIVWIIKEK